MDMIAGWSGGMGRSIGSCSQRFRILLQVVRLLEFVVKLGINSQKLSKNIFSKILEGKMLERVF